MAKTRAQIISEATLRARRDFLAFNKQAEQEILDIFINARLNLLRRISFGVSADKFVKARRLALLEQVDKQIAVLRIQLNSRIQSQMRNSIDLGLKTAIKSLEPTDVTGKINVGTSFIGADGKIRRYNAADEVFSASQWAKINTQSMDYLVKFRPTGNTFAQSVWGTSQPVQTRLRTMLNRAILLGDSSQRLARDITAYMSKEGIRLPSGSRRAAYKNAWRLARTEMNRAYTEGQVRYAKSKTWIDGVIWRRGGPGPCSTGQCPAGADRFYPKDQAPELPAHPNCLPGDVLVSAAGDVLGATRRLFKGEMLTIHTAKGKKLICTPNHPVHILNRKVPARCANGESVYIINNPLNDIKRPSRIEDIVDTFLHAPGMSPEPVKVTPEHFHGDGAGSEIAVVGSYRLLMNRLCAKFREQALQLEFFLREIGGPLLDSAGMFALGLEGNHLAAAGFMASSGHALLSADGVLGGPQQGGFFGSPNYDAISEQPLANSAATYAKAFREGVLGLTPEIPTDDEIIRQLNSQGAVFDKVTHIDSFQYDGWVYNIETSQSYYIANGIATGNCMCYFIQHIVGDDLPEGVDKGKKPPDRPIPTPPSRKDAEKVPTSGTAE